MSCITKMFNWIGPKTKNLLITLLVLSYLVVMIYLTSPAGEFTTDVYSELVAQSETAAENAVVQDAVENMTGDNWEETQVDFDNLTEEQQNKYDTTKNFYLAQNDAEGQKGDVDQIWQQHASKGLAVGAGIYSAFAAGKYVKMMARDGKNEWVKQGLKFGVGMLLMILFLVNGFTEGSPTVTMVSYVLAVGGLSCYIFSKTWTLSSVCFSKTMKYDDEGVLKVNDGEKPSGFTKFLKGFVNLVEHGKRNSKSEEESEMQKLKLEVAKCKEEAETQKNIAASCKAETTKIQQEFQKVMVPAYGVVPPPAYNSGKPIPVAVNRRRLPAMDTILSSIKF